MKKEELRTQYKNLRKQMTFDEIQNESLAIANTSLQIQIWDKKYYHLFLPIEKFNEVNTEYLLQILAGKDKEIILSKSDFETIEMSHFLLTDSTTIKINSFGIPEPEDGLEVPVSKIDVVFVPLLAYDKKGYRVGYGKGFYDKFLSQCKPETLKIGLSFFEPVDAIEDVSETDIKLDYCITPFETFQF